VDRLSIATLNIRNIADRWEERLPLLLADMAAVQPHLLALQEVVYPVQQDRLLGAAGEGRYEALRAWAGRPEYGNSLLVRRPLEATEVERLDLDLARSALRVRVTLPGGARLVFVVTHLHHVPADEALRDRQAAALLDWLEGSPDHEALVVAGDFNAEPGSATCERMRAAGFVSAYAQANGAEPAVTWPSGIVAPGMDTDGDPGCLDYAWLRGRIRAERARLAWDRPAVGDPTLYPSDHVGLVAEVVVA
jgi:endonuclease/exonuclease/phosphatase family metal-dependent hydrolase